MKALTSSDLKSLVYGMMLGDSTIQKNGKEFKFRQIEKTLVQYKLEAIRATLNPSRLLYKECPAHHCGKWNHQTTYEVRVKHEYFTKLYEVFYPNGGIKRVTAEMLRALKPNGIAVWLADDGSMNLIGKSNYLSGKKDRLTDRRLEICTDGFLLEDVELIKWFFDRRYGKDSTVIVNRDHKDKRFENATGYRLRFRVEAAQKLLTEVYREFFNYPELLYKMDMGYRLSDIESPYCKIIPSYWEAFQEISAHGKFIDRLARP